ncbi:site-specific integrase [Pseudomonas sp. NPDC047963]|uniref:site-specific integrase n=1 Tax=Stutzerimonas TaxID=2901164 RepID=UPI001BCD5B46|nr:MULTISPECIES: site-specific integrase [Stutzerimonas]MBU0921273.1 site-specific integrase [Gammaproteobacteria bacterium]MCH2340653.1 site-specific integrase [Pseudomonas sp.]
MSQRQSKTGVPHLVYQAKTGFQYYLTFPKHFAANPKLPAQIRWALSHDEALARDLAKYLNASFEQFLAKATEHYVELFSDRLLVDLQRFHLAVAEALKFADRVWKVRPSPMKLANQDLSVADARMMKESAERVVLYSHEPGGEIFFALTPTPALVKALGVGFVRFDWPLGTCNHNVASDAARYIYAALDVLETVPPSPGRYSKESPAFAAMTLYEYLCHARPDQGRNLMHIPPALPQSRQALHFHLQQANAMHLKLRIIDRAFLMQEESGLYVMLIELDPLCMKAHLREKKSFRIELLTSSIIIAVLMLTYTLQKVDKVLLRYFQEDDHEDPYAQAMQEIGDLVRRMLGSAATTEPMQTIPELNSPTDAVAPPQDPGTLALLNALGSVLPDAQKARLETLFTQPSVNERIVSPACGPNAGLSLAALVKEYEERQIREGAWANPRTRITARARLEGLCELLGGHRQVETLTRAEFNTLRDHLRSYPKNRHRLRATRNQPLSKIISDGKFEPINPRTAKKFFELARALVTYAHDQGYITENIAAGLAFSTKGAEAPRKRTYSPSQIEKLLHGPAYTLTQPPRWRLDDYKFWLPLLGLYTGARLSELCQLRLEDIRQELGVWIISINRTGSKQLKTSDSERLVPIHKQLIETGFLDYHQARLDIVKQDMKAPLFENIRVYGDLSPGHVASRWYLGSSQGSHGYLGLCGLGEEGLTYHGLRHTFINQFRRQNLDLAKAKALVGHADKSTTGGYGDCYPAGVLKDELDKIDFGLGLDHIHYRHYQGLQKAQGDFKVGRPVGTPFPNVRAPKRHWKSYA